MLTIGVLIAVPDPIGSELQARRVSFGDDRAHGIPTHVTLLAPTEVDEAALDEVAAHLQRTSEKQRPFEVRLEGTGSFRPTSPVVFVQVRAGWTECERLQQTIRQGHLRRPLPFAYYPHVTVAQHLGDASLDRAQAELGSYHARFEVKSFVLYVQGTDQVWRPARTFGFTAAPAAPAAAAAPAAPAELASGEAS